MPTYEYRCKDCNHQFEISQSFADDALTTCPECGGVLKKVFGNVGIAFKGGGFYKTDSRSSGSSGSSSSSSNGSSTKDSSSSGSSDSGSSNSGGSDGSSSSTSSTTTSSTSSSSSAD